jgi:hypothetical protein
MKTRISGDPQRLLEDQIEYLSRAKQNPIVCRLRKCVRALLEDPELTNWKAYALDDGATLHSCAENSGWNSVVHAAKLFSTYFVCAANSLAQ